MADYSRTIAFIKELYGNQDFTPLSVPQFLGNEKKYLEECIDTTFVSSVGKFVDRFEEEMARYTGAKKAVEDSLDILKEESERTKESSLQALIDAKKGLEGF